MNDEIEQTKDFLQDLSDQLSVFISSHVNEQWALFFQILSKFLLLGAIVYVIDFIFKNVINLIFRSYKDEVKYPLFKAIYKSKVSNSLAHLLALLCGRFAYKSIFYLYKDQFNEPFERLFELALVLVFAGLMFRILKALGFYFNYKNDYYRSAALKTISQTLIVVGTVVFSIMAISVLFGIKGTTILGSLGAMTAVIILVFRDTILGFVTGIHVATSQHIKEGDWIGLPKYNLEGTVESIDLLTVKILGFDKTVSTIPTYDLLSTEVRNLQVMSETNTRRIKKSIIFNIKSFKFLNDEDIKNLSSIHLISDYLKEKRVEIEDSRALLPNSSELINGKQITNIGTFRIYTLNYLRNNPNIDQNGTMIVRQLDIAPEGLPLEIYCFTNNSKWEDYEQIQADIFDHLLVASKEFDLEVMQFSKF